ncbi:4049_t:CDS:2, partial [Scutellospora calospora]
EIIDGQDGNMYLYVGEKNNSGGREIKIGITKGEFENSNEQIVLAWGHVAEINELLNDMEKNRPDYYAACDKNCDICGVKLCCHFEESKNNQISDIEKSQLRQYLTKNGIKKISLENGKLVIEYNNQTKETVESEDAEQKKYHQLIQNLPNKSLSLSELQTNNNSSLNSRNNNNLYQGLVVGVIGGI